MLPNILALGPVDFMRWERGPKTRLPQGPQLTHNGTSLPSFILHQFSIAISGKLHVIEQHLNQCEEEVIECKWDGCSEASPRRTIVQHEEVFKYCRS